MPLENFPRILFYIQLLAVTVGSGALHTGIHEVLPIFSAFSFIF